MFDTLIVRDFILEHTVDRSKEYARLLCTALRSFFRFVLLCGQTTRDLLLARLGLRGGEVVTLELDDIRWRAGEIVVRGKGRMVDHLPLLSDVGEALAVYIRKDRGVSTSRRVFLRT